MRPLNLFELGVTGCDAQILSSMQVAQILGLNFVQHYYLHYPETYVIITMSGGKESDDRKGAS